MHDRHGEQGVRGDQDIQIPGALEKIHAQRAADERHRDQHGIRDMHEREKRSDTQRDFPRRADAFLRARDKIAEHQQLLPERIRQIAGHE